MARLKGFEPLAHCLEGSCSIQLSYRRTRNPSVADEKHSVHCGRALPIRSSESR